MRKSLVALSVLAAAAALPAQAEYLYGFGNVSVNYLDWSKGTEQRSGGFKDDFVYLELEGGAGFTWVNCTVSST
ncbi:putative exported protein precursor [Photobacterium aphoticum]|uniref:Putative exported protein n=1 Tax=Photobacterium aphoticum TaxID=754436 RepID=A0A090QV56_9GAMM|nr:putative exported protein precursor [Photobacterium aphoticum]